MLNRLNFRGEILFKSSITFYVSDVTDVSVNSPEGIVIFIIFDH